MHLVSYSVTVEVKQNEITIIKAHFWVVGALKMRQRVIILSEKWLADSLIQSLKQVRCQQWHKIENDLPNAVRQIV